MNLNYNINNTRDRRRLRALADRDRFCLFKKLRIYPPYLYIHNPIM